jgi:CRP/FNR family cyclic AMP-dependent transcriptional regulator
MLERVPLFASLPAADVASVESHSAVRSYRKNTVVVQRGDESASLYVLVEGHARVFLADDHGREVTLNTLGPGDYFGELALLGETARTASVITTEDCRCMVISRAEFLDCLAGQPRIALALIRGLVERVGSLTEQVSKLALRDVYGRVRDTLVEQAREEGGVLVTPRLTHNDIAQMVGSSREMVSRVLKDLREGGYVSVNDKRIVLHKKLPERW